MGHPHALQRFLQDRLGVALVAPERRKHVSDEGRAEAIAAVRVLRDRPEMALGQAPRVHAIAAIIHASEERVVHGDHLSGGGHSRYGRSIVSPVARISRDAECGPATRCESTPRLRGHSFIRAGPRAGKNQIARVDDVHTHRVSTGEVRASSAPSPIETGSIKKTIKKSRVHVITRDTTTRQKKTPKKNTPPPPTRSSLGRDVDATTSRRARSFIHSVIHSFIHSGRGGESATRARANGWVR